MDEDLYHEMHREEYLAMLEPVFKKYTELFQSTNLLITKSGYKLHSVEIVGGGSRIPRIQQIIEKVFKLKPQQTLKATESIARGTAIQSAMLSSHFRVTDYKMKEINNYPIKC